MYQSETNGRVRVAIVDSMTLFREGLALILSESPHAVVVGSTEHPGELGAILAERDPDVVFVSSDLLENGLNATVARRNSGGLRRVIGILNRDDEREGANQAGATATLMRTDSTSDLLQTLCVQGTAPLTSRRRTRGNVLSPRERDVSELIASGLSNRSIADQLLLSEQSVKNLVSRILRKLRLTNRVQIAMHARDS